MKLTPADISTAMVAASVSVTSAAADQTLSAARSFDASRGWQFSTYAVRAIHTHMARGVNERTSFKKLNRIEASTGHRPAFHSIESRGCNEQCLRDIIPDRREPPAHLSDLPILLRKIPPRERAIVKRRVRDGLTLEAVGDEFGLTKERIRQIVERACATARSERRI